MSPPILPPPFDQIGARRFSMYPAIVNVEHNEWVLRKATWSEVLISNTKTGDEIWIPRRFVGEVSRTDEPVMILGVTKELEYKAGQVIPHVRRVIEMPKAVNETYRPAAPAAEQPPAAVVGIRLESSELRIGRLILWVLGGVAAVCAVVLAMYWGGRDPRVRYSPVLQTELGLTAQDDYHAVVRRLGVPASDTWRSEKGEMQYRIMNYPARGFSVVLMGIERERATYIGAVDTNWRPVDAVPLHAGKDTRAMLRALRP